MASRVADLTVNTRKESVICDCGRYICGVDLAREIDVAHVADDADDRPPGAARGTADTHALAYRIDPGEKRRAVGLRDQP